MSTELTAALAADRGIRRRAAAEVVPLPLGLVVRHPRLWDVHYLNAVIVTDPGPRGAAELAALADHWLADLAHRHLVFDDAATGEHAADTLGDAWERRRTVFMTMPGTAAAPAPDARARQISAAEMEALQLAAVREEVPEGARRTGVVQRLVDTQRTLRSTTTSRCFGSGEHGGLQSMCTLFLDDEVCGRRVAMITEVGTLPSHRGRGLARAVVGAAVAAARAWGADLIVVAADADDWPQLLYASLGFAPVGRQVSLTQRGGSGSGGL